MSTLEDQVNMLIHRSCDQVNVARLQVYSLQYKTRVYLIYDGLSIWKLAIQEYSLSIKSKQLDSLFNWYFNIDVEAKLSMARIDEEMIK